MPPTTSSGNPGKAVPNAVVLDPGSADALLAKAEASLREQLRFETYRHTYVLLTRG